MRRSEITPTENAQSNSASVHPVTKTHLSGNVVYQDVGHNFLIADISPMSGLADTLGFPNQKSSDTLGAPCAVENS